jgi:hypothetical protein
MRTATCLLATLMLFPAFVPVGALAEEPRYDPAGGKKLIHYGWDVRRPAWIHENIESMQSRPFDGVITRCHYEYQGKQRPQYWVLTDRKQTREDFAEQVELLKDTDFGRLTDNFLLMWGTTRGAHWFDDAFWKNVCNNVAISGWIAKQGGLVGICFDAEPYGRYNPWGYNNQPDANEHDFEEYYAKVRQRGREFMQALQSEYPDVQMLLFFGPFSNWPAVESPDPKAFLEQAHWGLITAFYQGWLDVLNEDALIHDCNELGYYYHGVDDFDRAARKINAEVVQLFDEDTRETYQRQVRCGSGLMIDFKPFDPTTPEENFLTPDRFERNLIWALRAADKYVWVYHMSMNWWTDEEGKPYPPEAYQQAVRNARRRVSREGWTHRRWYGATIKIRSEGLAAPTIDGATDDAAWGGASEASLAAPDGNEPAAEAATVRLLADADAIYLAWHVPAGAADGRATLCLTDSRGTWPYYRFDLAADGTTAEQFRCIEGFDLPWTAAVKPGENGGWTAEMAIPWRTLRLSMPDDREPLRAQLLLFDGESDEDLLQSWAPTRPGKIDFLHFGEWIVR